MLEIIKRFEIAVCTVSVAAEDVELAALAASVTENVELAALAASVAEDVELAVLAALLAPVAVAAFTQSNCRHKVCAHYANVAFTKPTCLQLEDGDPLVLLGVLSPAPHRLGCPRL